MGVAAPLGELFRPEGVVQHWGSRLLDKAAESQGGALPSAGDEESQDGDSAVHRNFQL